ncbi:hypothetical protein NSPZN2_40671 [Nitrospira defluvii]|uniref:Uncharacterized protein n=1 Tax=Nitrospira defluvii TaxID=330214 RepID=A0ABN7M0U5_9BACT|nr:hypothetical protein NSPZN2_40671 [Nitrospira defluvii]
MSARPHRAHGSQMTAREGGDKEDDRSEAERAAGRHARARKASGVEREVRERRRPAARRDSPGGHLGVRERTRGEAKEATGVREGGTAGAPVMSDGDLGERHGAPKNAPHTHRSKHIRKSTPQEFQRSRVSS